MSTRGMGFIRRVITNIKTRYNAEYGRPQGQLVGIDNKGNRFYEMPADPSRGFRKPKRWFEGVSDESWDEPMAAEWEAWLRYRRDNPPSDDEIERNIEMAAIRKFKAERISERFPLGKPKPDPVWEKYPKYDYELEPNEPELPTKKISGEKNDK